MFSDTLQATVPYVYRIASKIIILILFLSSISSIARAQPASKSFYMKVHGGISSYIGDNSVALLNRDAFSVENKWPYLYSIEVGYQWNARWRVGLGSMFADYPIITRFNQDIAFESHPTTRTTYQAVVNYVMGKGRLKPYAQVGMHLTFGDVSIYEASRVNDKPPEVHKHFMWGPIFGLGVDYILTPTLSVMMLASANATFVDDSADGRLPLGPPLPTNLREKDRFAPFDLLGGLSIGLLMRPFCKSGCQGLRGLNKEPGPNKGRSMLRVVSLIGNAMTTVSYHYALTPTKRWYLGLETGLGPKSIFVTFLYTTGQEQSDNINFSDAFAGLSFRYVGTSMLNEKLTPHAGIVAAIPRQVHLAGGLDYHISSSLAVGVEGRFTVCPSRDQSFFMHSVQYHMKSACEYRTGAGLTTSYRF